MLDHVPMERFDGAAARPREQRRHQPMDRTGQSCRDQTERESERHLLMLAIGLADTAGMIQEEMLEHSRANP